MEQAAILYGDFDGNGNALVIRTAGLSNLLYTVGGYLIGFTVNGIDYFHFDKTDFGKGDIFINAGYFSLEDWLSYWADEKKLSEIRKFDYVNFTKVKKDDQIVIEKQKTSLDTANYNWNEVYKYIWNVDEYRLPFSKDIYMPSNAVKTEKAYTEVNTATNFFQNAKILINLVESENQSNLMKTLVYSAYCIHHICASILPLFTEASHQQLIAEQKAYWSNPFPDTSGLSEFELINLTKDFYTEVLNFYVTGFRQKVRIQNAVGDKKFYHLTLLMSVKSLTTLTSKIKIKVLKSATNELSRFFESEAAENLIVRISSSFNNSTLNRIDEFLEGLVDPKNHISLGNANEGKVTLYQYIYDRMSTSWNFTKGLIQLSNWVVNTKFKPTDTKGAFVQTLYLLWQFSKYNPYNENGTLKQNIFYIESLEPISSKPASNDQFFVEDNAPAVPPSTIFKYSYETAYQFKKETNSVQTTFEYPIRYPDAAPLTMPYESEKKLGIYFDNFSFKFNGNKIVAIHEDLPQITFRCY